MNSREIIETRIKEIKQNYGEWFFDIPLPHSIWTRGNLKIPHTRLKRIFQIASDLGNKPVSECRILDLGCLDGGFSIEFAMQGAEVVGIEIRKENIVKAAFCKEVLGLNKLSFIEDDVRNISSEKYGKFDVIICSGIIYHLEEKDVFNLIEKMYEMALNLVIIDTHISIAPTTAVNYKGFNYTGQKYREHSDNEPQEERSKKLWASWNNTMSFWFTRPSLINLLSRTGFSSIYECFIPAHLNFGGAGVESYDRCTFVAVKGDKKYLNISPAANNFYEYWPENTLSYPEKKPEKAATGFTNFQPNQAGFIAKLKRFLNRMSKNDANNTIGK